MRPIPTAVLAALLSSPAAAQDGTRVFELHEIQTAPAVQNLDEFSAALREGYPPALRDSAIAGRVLVELVIGADGAVQGATVVEASRAEFGAPSIRAAEVLRFTPGAIEGRPVAVRAVQPVNWEVAPGTLAGAGRGAPQPGPRDVVAISRRMEAPRMLNEGGLPFMMTREYPPFFRERGVGGRVMVRFIVDTGGVPRDIRVVESTHEAFSAASERIVSQLRFTPGRRNGRPVPTWMALPLEWGIR